MITRKMFPILNTRSLCKDEHCEHCFQHFIINQLVWNLVEYKTCCAAAMIVWVCHPPPRMWPPGRARPIDRRHEIWLWIIMPGQHQATSQLSLFAPIPSNLTRLLRAVRGARCWPGCALWAVKLWWAEHGAALARWSTARHSCSGRGVIIDVQCSSFRLCSLTLPISVHSLFGL